MKKICLITFFLLSFIFCHPVAAADGPGQKLTRGAVNILTSPLEVPKQIRVYWKQGAQKTDHILVWILCGFVKGTVNTFCRSASGLWDVLTFPLNKPQNYAPLMQPEYVFEGWPRSGASEKK